MPPPLAKPLNETQVDIINCILIVSFMALFEIVGFTDFAYGYGSMMVKAATLYHLKKTSKYD